MVESADLELIHRDLLETCVALVSAPSQRGWVHWSYSREYCVDADGDVLHSPTDSEHGHADDADERFQSVSELWTGDWWRDTESNIPFMFGEETRRILAVGIATDETAITLTGMQYSD